jgi:hypothetical protein
MILYTDTGSKSEFDPNLVFRLNPNTQYIKHLENLFYLKFIELKSDKFFELAQAKKEIEICNKKLKFWERKITNQELIDEKTKELKAIWNNI